jgi:hypothetical protein
MTERGQAALRRVTRVRGAPFTVQRTGDVGLRGLAHVAVMQAADFG